MAKRSSPRTTFSVILIAAIIIAAAYLRIRQVMVGTPNGNTNTVQTIACTLEAKLCPNGTTVGRVAPKCDFAPCPGAANANANANTNAASNTNTLSNATTLYTDSEFNFSLQYPSTWTQTKSSTGSADDRIANYSFTNGTDGVTLTVASAALESMILDSFSVSTESAVTINGEQATRAKGSSAKDGSAMDLLFFHHSGKLFFLNGKGAFVDSIGKTLTFN